MNSRASGLWTGLLLVLFVNAVVAPVVYDASIAEVLMETAIVAVVGMVALGVIGYVRSRRGEPHDK